MSAPFCLLRAGECKHDDTHSPPLMMLSHRHVIFLLLFLCCGMETATWRLAAAESADSTNAAVSVAATNATAAVENNAVPRFNIVGYTIEGDPLLSTNVLVAIFSKYSGTNVTLAAIVKAAADLQSEYFHQGYPN